MACRCTHRRAVELQGGDKHGCMRVCEHAVTCRGTSSWLDTLTLLRNSHATSVTVFTNKGAGLDVTGLPLLVAVAQGRLLLLV